MICFYRFICLRLKLDSVHSFFVRAGVEGFGACVCMPIGLLCKARNELLLV